MKCAIHRIHYPTPETVELHHIVPVAWQLFWQPAQPWPFPGVDPDGRGHLWDARTIELCPTGHRNVHFYIVKMMHNAHSDDPLEAKKATPGRGTQYELAYDALCRFAGAGGSLTALASASEWGQS